MRVVAVNAVLVVERRAAERVWEMGPPVDRVWRRSGGWSGIRRCSNVCHMNTFDLNELADLDNPTRDQRNAIAGAGIGILAAGRAVL